MTTKTTLATACMLLLVYTAQSQNPLPVAAVKPVIDTYFNTQITDPYRWMEDLKGIDMQQWMKAQATYADAYLQKLPMRETIMKQLQSYNVAGARVMDVRRVGKRYFYLKMNPADNNFKVYMKEGIDGAEKLLGDPERYATNGLPASITTFSPSPDGTLVSIIVVLKGGEYGDIHVLRTTDGTETCDVITGTRWSAGEWLPDSKGFVYLKMPVVAVDAAPIERVKKISSYLHVLGTKEGTDKPVFGYGIHPKILMDEIPIASVRFPLASKYAQANVNSGVSRNSVFYITPLTALSETPVPWKKLTTLDDYVSDIAEHGDYLYLLTYKNTPRFKVVRVPIVDPDLTKAEMVFPASDMVIEQMGAAKDALYINVLDGGSRRVFKVDYTTLKSTAIDPPYPGSVSFADNNNAEDGALIREASWTQSNTLFQYDPKTNKLVDTKLIPQLPVDMSQITFVDAKAKSHDGTMVPMVILYKKGLKLDGSNPTLMNGYGAYGQENVSPFLDTNILPWLEQGGVFVWTGIRGGGEYGEEWHQGGFQKTKPNTWKDFIACGEYLIANRYTSPKHLGIFGGSAGGILIGNALAERPDLFGAAVSKVGISNSLRMETTPNGLSNTAEFGSYVTEEGFHSLMAMDSYLKIKDGVNYPAVLLMHGSNDPRVEPWMSAKMAARLQAASTSKKPILLRIDYNAGHGIGSSRSQRDAELAEMYAFLFEQLR